MYTLDLLLKSQFQDLGLSKPPLPFIMRKISPVVSGTISVRVQSSGIFETSFTLAFKLNDRQASICRWSDLLHGRQSHPVWMWAFLFFFLSFPPGYLIHFVWGLRVKENLYRHYTTIPPSRSYRISPFISSSMSTSSIILNCCQMILYAMLLAAIFLCLRHDIVPYHVLSSRLWPN